eukprot:7261961-Prymnesium_polylepis.1
MPPAYVLYALHYKNTFWVTMQVQAMQRFFTPEGGARVVIVDTACEEGYEWASAYRREVALHHRIGAGATEFEVLSVPHINPLCDAGSCPTKNCKEGAVYNWIYMHFRNSSWRGGTPRFFGTLHSDLFPIRPLASTVATRLGRLGVYASTNSYGENDRSWHVSPQLMIWELTFLDRLRHGRLPDFAGHGLEVGGGLRRTAPLPAAARRDKYTVSDRFVTMVRWRARPCAAASAHTPIARGVCALEVSDRAW